MNENWSLAAVALLLILLTVAGVWLLIPSIADQTDQLQETIPKSFSKIKEQLNQHPWGRWLISNPPDPEKLIPKGPDVFARITGVVSGLITIIGSGIVLLFTGLFFASQPRLYTEGLVKLVPIRKRERAREVIGEIGSALKWWLVGQLLTMLFIGVLTWLGLLLLGIKMALTLAVLAAVLTFIPTFGPIAAAVPAVLVGLMDSPTTALWVIVLYVSVQGVETYILTPLIQQQAVSLPPALLIMSQLIMAVLVGGLGLALATPLLVTILVLVRSLYVRDLLGDESTEAANAG